MEFRVSKKTLNEIQNKYDSKIINGIVVPTWEGVIQWFLEHGGGDVGIPPDFRTIGINSNTKLEVIGYDNFAWFNKRQIWTQQQTFNGYVQTYYNGIHTNYGANTITKNIDGGESYTYYLPNANGTLALDVDVQVLATQLADEIVTRQLADNQLQANIELKQDINAPTLHTRAKTIVEAINEINDKPTPESKILQEFNISLSAPDVIIDDSTYRVTQLGNMYIHTFRFSMSAISITRANGKFILLLDTDEHITRGSTLLALTTNVLNAFATIYVPNHQMYMLGEYLKNSSETNAFEFVGTILE